MSVLDKLRHAQQGITGALGIFWRDVGHGLLEIGHNTLAVLGLVVVAITVFAAGQADLRQQAEVVVLDWLQTRHEERSVRSGDLLAVVGDIDAVARATASDLKDLSREQAAVARWISRRYKVAPEPISRLVQEAWSIGQRAGIEPTLILAVMAVESSFNPFAQSAVGAQGLMQVMTRVHDDKYEAFGGTHAAFDPVSNLRVGVQVLKECILRAGSLHEGLRFYVGAALLDGDGGYVGRVLSEQVHLRNVANGKGVPVNAPILTMVAPAAKEPTPGSTDKAPAELVNPAADPERLALLR